MKANLKKLVGLAALGITLLATTIPTWAGRVSTGGGVSIVNSPTYRSASGSMVGTRHSADTRQQIGCRAYTLSAYSWTSCHATDSAGRSLLCGSGDWKFLEVVHGMTDSSFISFVVDPNGTGCSDIRVYHGSDMLK
jgi:hypothetical protein